MSLYNGFVNRKDTDMEIKIASNLRNLRKQNNMTQEELAERLNVSLGVISKWERGASEPELSCLVAMAKVFNISVDALIGYDMGTESPEQIINQVGIYKKDLNIAEAIDLVNDALLKFPNNLKIVHCAASVFMLSELAGCGDHYDRAIELFHKSITLLSQDTLNEFSEPDIQNDIAYCLIQQEKIDEAIEVLKSNNIAGINDDMLGMLYVLKKGDYPKGIEYLASASSHIFNKFVQVISGFANAYVYTKRYDEAEKLCSFFDSFTKAATIDSSKPTFLTKLNATFHAAAGDCMISQGKPEAGRNYYRKAYESAVSFDLNPTHGVENVLMMNELPSTAAVYDQMGLNAMESVENQILSNGNETAANIWKEIRKEYENT